MRKAQKKSEDLVCYWGCDAAMHGSGEDDDDDGSGGGRGGKRLNSMIWGGWKGPPPPPLTGPVDSVAVGTREPSFALSSAPPSAPQPLSLGPLPPKS